MAWSTTTRAERSTSWWVWPTLRLAVGRSPSLDRGGRREWVRHPAATKDKNPEVTVRTSFPASRWTSDEPSLPAWIAAALPSDVTIQNVDYQGAQPMASDTPEAGSSAESD